MKMQLERVAFESKEAAITMDGLKEANSELTTELDETTKARSEDAYNRSTPFMRLALREMIPPDEPQELRIILVEAEGIVRQGMSSNATTELGVRRANGAQLSEADIDEVKSRLSEPYTSRRETQAQMIKDMREDLARKDEENHRLKMSVEESQRAPRTNGATQPTATSRTVQQQIADFDVMKKSPMRIFKIAANIIQQPGTAEEDGLLERNLEQLTHVQRQLVEQNGTNHRFEATTTAVKERLEAAQAPLHA
ncbi:hypothetical protein HO133_003194 [Letharia lupina]|uniref:Uncharacterized protein n=1 Tax=Letharia lupina TaxID=560253 RepID=A0A8H6CAP9_9LECA|nr:uncharacterized protein HO133_003194 [Letharia lupina]KAF6220063.1 hypothetical protein HO133_003194 [Letharia lupina]